MPDLVQCSDWEWEAVLPRFVRPVPEGQKRVDGVDLRPLRVYQRAIRKQVDRGVIPGYCFIVAWRDQVLHIDAYGCADVERGVAMRTDTLVRLYCMGKSVVAAALMVLVERGLCALEDEVARYLPAFGRVRVKGAASAEDAAAPAGACASKVTLRRLLTHCSGLGYGKEFNLRPESPTERAYAELVLDVECGRVRSAETFCDRLAALPLRFAPGEAFEYSYGLDVIGRVIEVVSKKTLDLFLEEAIFQPLGMADTGFFARRAALPRLAALYGGLDTAQALGVAPAAHEAPKTGKASRRKKAPEWALVRLDGRAPRESAWAKGLHCPVLSGGGFMGYNRGGLVSTLNDQARFFLTVARGGQLSGCPRLMREDTVREMVGQDWLRLPESMGRQMTSEGKQGVAATGPFGWNALGELGVEADSRKLRPDAFELGEYGYAGIAETFWSINPRKELVILWFTQQVDNHSWTTPEANLWLAARRAVEQAAAPAPAQPQAPAPAGAGSGGRPRSRSPQARRRRLAAKSRPHEGGAVGADVADALV